MFLPKPPKKKQFEMLVDIQDVYHFLFYPHHHLTVPPVKIQKYCFNNFLKYLNIAELFSASQQHPLLCIIIIIIDLIFSVYILS